MRTITRVFLGAAGLWAAAAPALELDPLVPPEINLGGRALATINGHQRDTIDGEDADSEIDTSDSSLLFGFSKYLFGDERYGFGVVGLKKPEPSESLEGEVFFHELHVGIGGANYEVKLGRSRLRNTLLSFPTVRDDDLLAFTHVGNASSAADTELYEIFGNTAEVAWWPTRQLRTHVALNGRTETDATGAVTQDGGFNGANVGVSWGLPSAIKFDRGLRFAGLTVDVQEAEGLGNARMQAAIAGFIYNLNSNPEADWVWETQFIANEGVVVSALDTELARRRAESRSLVTAVRFNKRPYLQTRWQAALTAAWKDFPGFDDVSSYAIAPSFVYRLGSAVDWVTQYVFTHYRGGLAQASGIEQEHALYTGLSFGFAHTFNESVGERESILSIEHDMGTIGPVGGGH